MLKTPIPKDMVVKFSIANVPLYIVRSEELALELFQTFFMVREVPFYRFKPVLRAYLSYQSPEYLAECDALPKTEQLQKIYKDAAEFFKDFVVVNPFSLKEPKKDNSLGAVRSKNNIFKWNSSMLLFDESGNLVSRGYSKENQLGKMLASNLDKLAVVFEGNVYEGACRFCSHILNTIAGECSMRMEPRDSGYGIRGDVRCSPELTILKSMLGTENEETIEV